jgi:hypothetical protein
MNSYGIDGASATGLADLGPSGSSSAHLSPETLLDYCQTQLDGLDSEIQVQFAAQQQALKEREAVQGAQKVLEQFGTEGPGADSGKFQDCVNALNDAIAQLPADDPVAAQLATFRDKMIDTYGYKPEPYVGQPPSTVPVGGRVPTFVPAVPHGPGSTVWVVTNPSTKDGHEWQGTTSALANIADDVKSGAEIQMLTLQDLVSQRQQAVQIATSMMSKMDQTLESQAQAIGH